MGEFFLQIILYIYNTIAFKNLGVAIVEIAVLSRVVFYPFTKQQLHYSKKMNEIQPQIAALKEKHKGNQQSLASAQMELFKQHGINPAAGCLPTIVQLVILFGLIDAMNRILTMNLHTQFLFWDVAKPDLLFRFPQKILTLDGFPGVLVILSSLTFFLQSKMMMPSAPKIRKEDKPEEKKEKSDFASDFAEVQSSMIWLFPIMLLFMGVSWPSGLALYWTVGTIISIGQQYQVSGLGGLQPYVVKLRSVIKR